MTGKLFCMVYLPTTRGGRTVWGLLPSVAAEIEGGAQKAYWGQTTAKREVGALGGKLSAHAPCRPYKVPACLEGPEQTCPLGEALVGGNGQAPLHPSHWLDHPGRL